MRKSAPGWILIGLLGVIVTPTKTPALIYDHPPKKLIIKYNGNTDFNHKVGKAGSKGWELDYKRDLPGYALSGLKDPFLLEPGFYRASYIIRRGNYPKKGLFHKTFGLFRIEIWDVTTKDLLVTRELQVADFGKPNHYVPRRIEFSTKGREGHQFEPRAYWIGLANGEVQAVHIEKFPQPDLKALRDKALRLGDVLEREHLENGFVVSRKPNGEPDETGDATTYTGLYLASLAWKYAVTGDAATYGRMENAIQTLHTAIKGTEDEAMPVRFVDKNGDPFPKSPSKDVYTFFFLGYSVAFPHVKNEALKEQMIRDIEKLAYNFLDDDLGLRAGGEKLMSLAPYFTKSEIRHGINKVLSDPRRYHNILEGFKKARRYVPIYELWPGMKKVMKAFKEKNEDWLIDLVLPTLNGLAGIAERAQDILQETYREDLLFRRNPNPAHSGVKLEKLLAESLKKIPHRRTGRRFENLSDLRILASNALISLHLVRTAQVITNNIQFEEYYNTNLYSQDKLLETALNWYGIEDQFIILTSGNPAADRDRRGYLSALSLTNLIQLETNPAKKASYRKLLMRWCKSYRHEDNPMAEALHFFLEKEEKDRKKTGPKVRPGLLLRGLELYPENRTGFGKAYWKEKGEYIGATLGGGVYRGYAREPLPVSHRPKDSFLWQRNARRLKGDRLNTYPATDYLFLYWFARYHGIIPPDPDLPSAQKSR